MEGTCKVCQCPIIGQRKSKQYCSAPCRQKAFFQRRHDATALVYQAHQSLLKEIQGHRREKELAQKITSMCTRWQADIDTVLEELGNYRSQRQRD